MIESRGEDFIAKILSEVKQLAYSRSGSNTSLKGKQEDNVPEFTKMKNGLLNTQVKRTFLFTGLFQCCIIRLITFDVHQCTGNVVA